MGQVVSPELRISDDGTQTFSCKIPKYYIDQKTNQKIINPRWSDAEKGILAQNTRILKVFVKYSEINTKVFPLIVDKITDRRDANYSVYKEISASGLAFAELGKVGYKLDFTSQTIEDDYAKDNTIAPTINYWLDKVFPNEKDGNGKVIKWLSPWCYEIQMDWSAYSEDRDAEKVYEEPYVSSWETNGENIIPVSINSSTEKARYVQCEKSNKYNITQDIAKAFEVFVTYEYKCATNGNFIGSYVDENGDSWTGKKVIFYNSAIKTEKPLYLNYLHNLQTIAKTTDSSEIYSKLYIPIIQSDTMSDGAISIANTMSNPLLDDFILNFDYLYSIGSITDYQKTFVDKYAAKLRAYNQQLIDYEEKINNLAIYINELAAEQSSYEHEVSSAKEQLVGYETLRDNEITNTAVEKNINNSYYVIFVPDASNNITEARITLEGVDAGTMVGYKTPSYSAAQLLFTGVQIGTGNKITDITSNPETFFVELDDYGFPISIYTSLSNSQISADGDIAYLELLYSPFNKYDKICQRFKDIINGGTEKAAIIKEKIISAQKDLDGFEEKRDFVLQDKEQLNRKLESTLGPALREGYWQPDEYEDPGQSFNEVVSAAAPINGSSNFIFDETAFETETLPYYYATAADLENDNRTYYKFIDISSIVSSIAGNENNLIVELIHPTYTFVSATNTIQPGNYFVAIDTRKWYFNLPTAVNPNTTVTLNITTATPQLTFSDGRAAINTTLISNGGSSLTNIFEGLGSYLSKRHIYNRAGFEYYFIKRNDTVIPALLLNNTDIDYDNYSIINYSFSNNSATGLLSSVQEFTASHIAVYPRIKINQSNVRYLSDLFTVQISSDELPLTNYEDYSILLRAAKPYITLKITNNNPINSILNKSYVLNYQVSRANEMLYLDAKQVAKDNSQPKYSYELSKANIPDEVEEVRLGQLTYINDSSLGIHTATGYISEVVLKLDQPKEDNIVIKNYKTKFEDLFSTITASSEAMKNNQRSYDIAAGSFTPNGTLNSDILQRSISQNNISFSFSNTKVQIDDNGGIVLTNEIPYSNGVYGQVVLRGGGIYCSNSVDAAGNRIWSSAITPSGINAALITAGQLDTNLIKIFAGNQVAFQWNGEGLYAYSRDDSGAINQKTYIQYYSDGLRFVENQLNNSDITRVEIGWNGLILRNNQGDTVFYADNDTGDLTITGTINAAAGNIGGWKVAEKYLYSGNTNSYVALSSDATSPVRIWAGANDNATAPFRVQGDGTLYASNAEITGTINADAGRIGQWYLANNDLYSGNGNTYVALSSDAAKTYAIWAGSADYNTAPFKVSRTGELYATKGSINGDMWVTGKLGTPLFVSGALGTGWQIDGANATATFNDLNVRGVLNAVTFQYEKISSVGGSLYIAPTILTTQNAALSVTNGITTVTFNGITPTGRNWAVNDIIKLNGIIVNGAADAYDVDGIEGKITAISDTSLTLELVNTTLKSQGTGTSVDLNVMNGYMLAPNASLIYYGTSTDAGIVKEGILITAAENNSPYIDVYDKSEAPVVRMGRLDGITDDKYGTLSGYGLYSENVYLTGAINATSGHIGSLTIADVENKIMKNEEMIGSMKGVEIISDKGFNFSIDESNASPSNIFLSAKGRGISLVTADPTKFVWQYSQDGTTWGALGTGDIYNFSYVVERTKFLNRNIYVRLSYTDIDNTIYQTQVQLTEITDGESPVIVMVESETGDIYINSSIVATLIATAYKDNIDISDNYTAASWDWKKRDQNGTEDVEWNAAHVDAGRTIEITKDDVFRKAVFTCELSIE